MWTNENRARYDRSRLRYPSDLTDEEWDRVTGGSHPPPVPTERGVRISRTTLFGN